MSKNSSILYVALPIAHSLLIHDAILSNFNDFQAANHISIGFTENDSIPDYQINDCRRAFYTIICHEANLKYEKLFLENFQILLKLITRQQLKVGDLSYDAAEYLAFNLKVLASSIFCRHNCKLIYSKSYPQFAFEYCLMLCAQAYGVRFIYDGFIPYFDRILLQQCEVKNGFFTFFAVANQSINHDIDAIFRPSKNSIQAVLDKIINLHTNPSIRPGDETYIPYAKYLPQASISNSIRLLYYSLREFISYLFKRHCLSNDRFIKFRIKNLWRNKLIAIKINLLDAFLIKPIISNLASRRLLKTYIRSINLKNNCDQLGVIYFAGQEPEASILVNGGKYNTNIMAINYLRSMFPVDVKIGYKEALTSFFPNMHSGLCTEPENKIPYIYSWISKMKNVYLLGETSKSNLFKTNKVFASICGTIGFEASLMGQKVLLFSHQWYTESSHPNINIVGVPCSDNPPLNSHQSREFWADFLFEYLKFSMPIEVDSLLFTIDRTQADYLEYMILQLKHIFS